MASVANKPCLHDGCPVARHVSASGEVYPRCQQHQREHWARNKVATPGLKKRGPAKGTKYAPKAQAMVLAPVTTPEPVKAAPKITPVPKRGGVYDEDVPMQFVVIAEAEGFYEVYLAVVVDRRAFDEVRTPARVRQRYSDCIAIVEKRGVLG